MSILIFNNEKEINSVFQLLGTQENDITKAIVWVLKTCPSVLESLIKELCGMKVDCNKITIEYQKFEMVHDTHTYTDMEIYDDGNFHIILEAKRGWNLPKTSQLEIYSKKESFFQSTNTFKKIFSISECTDDYANRYLPLHKTENGIEIGHISWKKFREICMSARNISSNKEKYVIDEFLIYLEGIMTMRNVNSNNVYVVSLSYSETCKGYTYVDVVKKTRHYFCPRKWFKNDANIPNYFGFRYDARLQEICHVDKYVITRNLHDVLSYMPDYEEDEEFFVFSLGEPIRPNKIVKCGPKVVRSTRIYADIDLLLTCDTLTEAMEKSKERRES